METFIWYKCIEEITHYEAQAEVGHIFHYNCSIASAKVSLLFMDIFHIPLKQVHVTNNTVFRESQKDEVEPSYSFLLSMQKMKL